MNAVLDNDVLHKGTCYGILPTLLQLHGGVNREIGILGAARFVLLKKIERGGLKRGTAAIRTEFEQWVSSFSQLDPTSVEQVLASDFESLAQRLGVSLDAGESQLCAIVLERMVPLLLSGDKRAIAGIELLLDLHSRLPALGGRIKCLEQLVLEAIDPANVAAVRKAVCSEPTVDKTLTICFACQSSSVDIGEIKNGLNSYIKALRAFAKRVLAS
jgi:hypothetical protein